jgi:hypothetical protein
MSRPQLHRAGAVPVGRRLPVVDPEPSPVGPPKICRQDSITVPGNGGAKHCQELAYGSDEWVRVYFHLRNSVEAINGYAKDPLHESMEAGGSRRIRGIASTRISLLETSRLRRSEESGGASRCPESARRGHLIRPIAQMHPAKRKRPGPQQLSSLRPGHFHR